MTILSDRDIVKAVDDGNLGVSPWNDKSLTPNGYDVRVAEISINGVIHGADEEVVRIPPKTMFFVSTIERVRMADDVCGNLWLRTSWIRKGTIAAFGMVDAGFEGTLTLGSYNSSDETLEIPIGERYCQLVFQTMTSASEKSYAKRSGHYQGQTGVTLKPVEKK
jgi:dCTP deaminase